MESALAVLFGLSVCCATYYLRAWQLILRFTSERSKVLSQTNVEVQTSTAPSRDQTKSLTLRQLPPKTAIGLHSVGNYKELFYQLHHVEQYPEALHAADRLLSSLMTQTNELASRDKSKNSIMRLDKFTDVALSEYILNMEMTVQDEYTEYMEKRRAGQPRDLFTTVEDAAQWLKNISPVKLVDGAWLGNLRVATQPFDLQPIIRIAWQVLSEELGDGVLDQNHVHVFQNLVRSAIPDFPTADSREFVDCHPDTGNTASWRSALAQLTISLFPNRYVPEILGFNMHFELVTLETLKASTELKEIGLNPLYFLLHICIDNSDVGHTAMALQTVIKYMKYVEETEGKAAVEEAWRRVQAGFALSQYVGQISDEQAAQHDMYTYPLGAVSLKSQVIEIFRKKTQPARSVHCASSIKIKGLTIEQWLSPERWDYPEWQHKFMDALASTKPWVIRGDRNRSRLMRDLNWGGKMFGAFTAEECDTVGQWIDSLVPETKTRTEAVLASTPAKVSSARIPDSPTHVGKLPSLERLLPLWFSSAGLLEGFCAIPANTTSHYMMHILSTLRSQSGLGDTTYGVAAVDELPRSAALSLQSLGQEMIGKAGLPAQKSVYSLLESWPTEFGWTMMNLAQATETNGDYLVGMALAFANLHQAMATSSLLCSASQTALHAMARSEIFHLERCRELMQKDKERMSRFDQGYWRAKGEIDQAFTSTSAPAVAAC